MSNPHGVMINDMVFELMYTLLNVETYIIVLNMVIDFQFKTVVDQIGQVFIIGVDVKGKELFRFNMDETKRATSSDDLRLTKSLSKSLRKTNSR